MIKGRMLDLYFFMLMKYRCKIFNLKEMFKIQVKRYFEADCSYLFKDSFSDWIALEPRYNGVLL